MRNEPHFRARSRRSISGGSVCADGFLGGVPFTLQWPPISSGLQWFLSFYLIFLVESEDAHKGAILLLDEPGLTLHALAQEDLSDFFENLSKTNQIVYSTHSAHMIHADHLDPRRLHRQ